MGGGACQTRQLQYVGHFPVPYSTGHRRHTKVHERTPSLQWTVSGWAVVEYMGQLYKVSTAQMLVLMQFNDVDVSACLTSGLV